MEKRGEKYRRRAEAQRSEGQRRVKRIALVALTIAATAAVALLIVWLVISRRPIAVVAPALTTEQTEILSDYLSTNPPDARYTLAEQAPSGLAPRVIVDLLGSLSDAGSSTAALTLTEPAAPIPASIIRSALTNGDLFAYPIALDHVEVAYRRDLFDPALLTTDDRIRDLTALERGLTALIGSEARYPLVAAGGEDQTLIDVVSVLALSVGGAERYRRLLQTDASDPAGMVAADLGDGWTLQTVLDVLVDWKNRGLVHPNWTELSRNDVRELAQRQLAGAIIMRLSTHRRWPVQTLHRIQTTPFPFANAADAGDALVAPVVAAAYFGRAGRVDEATRIIETMIGRQFQDDGVRAWRLAPVHSTAEPLDRESRDLRFWAAASRLVLPSLADALPPDDLEALASSIRTSL